ncbi:MAG: NADP-dependent oxidoreductase [Candidatus Dormibacteria bacterium]
MDDQVSGREVRLARRPSGIPTQADFEIAMTTTARQADQVLVRNLFLSVDPYMRGRMHDAPSYVPPFQLGRVMDGGALGEVISAPADSPLSPGRLVLHNLGWREYAVGDQQAFRVVDPIPGVSPSAFLGALGMPGLTAYIGLLDIGQLAAGESVFVSGAAGAVGGMVGQLARLHHAGRVIGSAGSDAKVEHLVRDLGFDQAFNYRAGPVVTQLAEACGDGGIDIYFDNVGGEQMEAALSCLRPHGRVAMCGAISQYNQTEAAPGPRNLSLAVGKRLRLQGFLVSDHMHRQGAFRQEVAPAVADGLIRVDETVVEGIENMPEAMIGMLQGANRGKMVIKV